MTKTRALNPARRLGHVGLLALSALALSGCGGLRTTSQTATGGSTTRGQPVANAHGELVRVPLLAGGHTLAFLQDGASVPMEVDDLSALEAAGARLHSSLTLSGDRRPNGAGQTALAERLRVSAFALDDVATAGHLELTASGPTLRTVDGVLYELLGAPALQASPTSRPLWVTGLVDPMHMQLVGPGLRVSSWRPTSTVTLRAVGGMLGLRQAFAVDDLDRTGACRFDTSFSYGPSALNSERAGRGRLEESDRSRLDALVRAANLRVQPTLFTAVIPIMDVPTTFLEYANEHGPVSIRIDAGAVLPTELRALIQELQRLSGTLPVLGTLAKGAVSGQSAPSIHVARDPASWAALWALHSSAPLPSIDFQKELVVAAFMGQRTTSGYAIEVGGLERVGDDLDLSVTHSNPTGLVSMVLTAPFHFAVVQHRGANGDVYVDGVKR